MGLCASKSSTKTAGRSKDPDTPLDQAYSSPDDSPTKPLSATEQASSGPITANGKRTTYAQAANNAPAGYGSTPEPGVRLSRPQALQDNPAGLTRPESPETMRITTRVLPRNAAQQETITTIWQPDDDLSGEPTSMNYNPVNGALRHPQHVSQLHETPVSMYTKEDANAEAFRPKVARLDSVKASMPAILTFEQGCHSTARSSSATSSQDAIAMEESLRQLAPSVTYQSRQLRLSPPGETILSLSDDDDEGTSLTSSARFDMDRWKRHYHWNRNKQSELLRFLWKHYDRTTWTFYCITYKQQSSLFCAYQGENIIHGLVCRIEDMLCPEVKEGQQQQQQQQQQLNQHLFGVIHNMLDHATNSFKVVGILLAHGTSKGPACLAGLHELMSDWSVLPADVSDPLVRTLVGNLITCQPPSPHCNIIHSREIL